MPRPLQQVDYSAILAVPSVPELELMRLYPRDAPLVIFDVGACEGEDSVRYARRFPRARLFTFEPLPDNQALIRETFTRHAVSRAELVPLALSDRTGEAAFHVSSGRPDEEFAGREWNYGNKSSSLLPPAGNGPMYGWIEFKETIRVLTETVDHFCATRGLERIDFMHLDVQGSESLVLAGATHMLPRIGALWLEVSDRELYAGQLLRPAVEARLRSRGFALVHEDRHGIEGDQFYVNLRRPASWLCLLRHRLAAAWGRLRFAGGAVKARLLGR